MAVYFVFDLRGAGPARLPLAFDASTITASARGAQLATPAKEHARGGCAPKPAPDAPRPQATGGKKLRIAAFVLLALCSGGLVSLSASPAAVTAAVTVCAVSALLGVRQVAGRKLTDEIASWVALAASIAGLAFAVDVANTGPHEHVHSCPVTLPPGRVERDPGPFGAEKQVHVAPRRLR